MRMWCLARPDCFIDIASVALHETMATCCIAPMCRPVSQAFNVSLAIVRRVVQAPIPMYQKPQCARYVLQVCDTVVAIDVSASTRACLWRHVRMPPRSHMACMHAFKNKHCNLLNR